MKAIVHSITEIQLIAETDADFALLNEWSTANNIKLASSTYQDLKTTDLLIEFAKESDKDE
jgi:hypothetical protein